MVTERRHDTCIGRSPAETSPGAISKTATAQQCIGLQSHLLGYRPWVWKEKKPLLGEWQVQTSRKNDRGWLHSIDKSRSCLCSQEARGWLCAPSTNQGASSQPQFYEVVCKQEKHVRHQEIRVVLDRIEWYPVQIQKSRVQQQLEACAEDCFSHQQSWQSKKGSGLYSQGVRCRGTK